METFFYPMQNVDTVFESTIQYEPIVNEPIVNKPIAHEPTAFEPTAFEPTKQILPIDCPYCYSKKSNDARCLGVCFFCCHSTSYKDKFELCPINLYDYWMSCYIQSNDRIQHDDDEDTCRYMCCPVRFLIFCPCFLGALFNGTINSLRKTDLNYIF